MANVNPYRAPRDTASDMPSPPDKIPGGAEAASRQARLAAAFIDAIPVVVLYVLLVQAIEAWRVLQNRPIWGPTFVSPAPLFSVSTIMWLFAAYEFVQAGLITIFGQSFGKLIMKIRIVRIGNDANPGFVRGVLLRRWLISVLGVVPLFCSRCLTTCESLRKMHVASTTCWQVRALFLMKQTTLRCDSGITRAGLPGQIQRGLYTPSLEEHNHGHKPSRNSRR